MLFVLKQENEGIQSHAGGRVGGLIWIGSIDLVDIDLLPHSKSECAHALGGENDGFGSRPGGARLDLDVGAQLGRVGRSWPVKVGLHDVAQVRLQAEEEGVVLPTVQTHRPDTTSEAGVHGEPGRHPLLDYVHLKRTQIWISILFKMRTHLDRSFMRGRCSRTSKFPNIFQPRSADHQ